MNMRIGSVLIKVLHRLKRHIVNGITMRFRSFIFTVDISLLLMTPVMLWAIATVYVPIMGTGLSSAQAWAISGVILVSMFLSVFLHSLAHAIISRSRNGPALKHIYMSPLGDPAQSQPAASSAGKEALTALAGPLILCLVAALSYVLWNLQINTFITVTAFFLIFFNLGLAAINLTPAFPFDGGRLLRAAMWKLLDKPGLATRLAIRMGWGLSAGLTAWSIFLVVQQDRFSLQTAGITFLVGILAVISLVFYKSRTWDKPEPSVTKSVPAMILRTSIAVVLMLPLAAITLCLLPLNQGLEAPGFTASVEPMVQVPAEYRNDSSGSLILVTVIPQAPIIAGEWVYAHLDNSIRLTPPEQIVPKDKTAQSVSREDYQMLLDSKTTAVIVGLRLAGFSTDVNNEGARITSVLESSPANAFLQPDDIISEIDGNTVASPSDLTSQLHLLSVQSVLKMKIERAGQVLFLDVPTMEPQETDGAVRIGISVVQHSTGYTLPFPVDIVPEKVNGGPSAGLMFTLGVYDLVTENDLTGGRTIAGTGTIDLNGNVGPIGGVQQKVVAAERAGAEYFLSPAENYADALAIDRHIKVIKVTTAQEAIDFLMSLQQD